MATILEGDITINGNLTVLGGTGLTGLVARSNLALESDMDFDIPLTQWRVWDALASLLPGTAAADDLGLTSNTFGTSTPYISSGDLNAVGAITRYARALIMLPESFVGGQNFLFQFGAGMLTSVASVSATIDLQVYQTNGTTGISGGDLCATAAQSINSTTFNQYQFTITGTTVERGDILDIRMTLAANSATASTHFAALTRTNLRLPIKG